MDTIIVTGFEPFGNYKYNPVQDMTLKMNKRIINNIQIVGVVLPCTYFGAFEVLKNVITQHDPIAVISTGFSSSVQGIMVETTAHNTMGAKYADADGKSPNFTAIIKNAEKKLNLNSNAQKIFEILKGEGISSGISENCEYFICNSLMYLITHFIKSNNLLFKNIFLHTPWTDNFKDRVGDIEKGKIRMPNQDLHRGIETIVTRIGEV